MISTFRNTLSSFTSVKKPKFLKRPSSDISTPSNDPATFPPGAHMPHSPSRTSTIKETKRQKGAKATDFINHHFPIVEADDDSVETASSREPDVRRITSTSLPAPAKKREISPSSIRTETTDLKSRLNHQHLIVDPDERSLFPGNAPPDPGAIFITVPGSKSSDWSSSSNSMRAGSSLRPIDTLNNPKSNQAPLKSRDRRQESCSKHFRSVGSKNYMHGLKTDQSVRNGTDEPAPKRRRVESGSRSYVRKQGAGAVSPSLKYPTDDDLIGNMSRPLETAGSKQPRSNKACSSLPLAVDEYHSLEKAMQSRPSRTTSRRDIPSHSAVELSTGHRPRSEESDPEKFTRESKRARLQHHGDDDPGSAPNSRQFTHQYSESPSDTNTPPLVREVFRPSVLPGHGRAPSRKARSHSGNPPTAVCITGHKRGHTIGRSQEGANLDAVAAGRLSSQQAVNPIAEVQSTVPRLNADGGRYKFALRRLKYQDLPEYANYVAVVAAKCLQLYDTKPALSRAAVAPIELSKIRKGSPYTKIHLELNSREDKEKLLLVMLESEPGTSKVQKEDEHIRKCFDLKPERLAEAVRQPSRIPQLASISTSHFRAQHMSSENNQPRPSKLISQLQSSSSTSNKSDTEFRNPTIITGKGRANKSPATSAKQISVTVEKKHPSEGTQPPGYSRLRFSSCTVPVTWSSHKAEMPSNASDDALPRRKYSELHGFGEPWKTPLVYPKTGKRRMMVEYGDLFRLDEDEFLNDNLIGFFLRYLEHHLEQTNPQLAKRVYFYNSYFFESLMQTSKGRRGINYASVQKWTRNVDIFNHDFIVVPVNESLHWYVVIICNLSKLSSLASNGESDVVAEKTRSAAPAVNSNEGEEEARKGQAMDEAHDQPTKKTMESLTHLSLSDHHQQIDELAQSTAALSPPSSLRSGSTPRKTGPGRRKGIRRSLPINRVSAPMIVTLDSLGAPRSSTCTALRQYITEEAKDKKGWNIDGSLIRGMTAKGIPTQPNYSDCGLYLCAYLEKFILNPDLFMGRILRRTMDPNIDMPMMVSQELRSRMRGLIMGLYHEQQGEGTELSIPRVGEILLAQPKTNSRDGNSALRNQLQDDSEDELQRDRSNLVAHGAACIPPGGALDAASEESENSALGTAHLRQEYPPSDKETTMAAMLATINASAHPSKKKPSPEERPITIDDDDDLDSVPKSAFRETNPMSKDDLFDHHSELRKSSNMRKTSAPNEKMIEEATVRQLVHHRSQSRASADTVHTEYLTGKGNMSYVHDGNAGRPAFSLEDERARKVVVLIPDSWENLEEEGTKEVRRAEKNDEPQAIIEGIE